MSEKTRRAVLTGAASMSAAVVMAACDPQTPGGFPLPSGAPNPSDLPGLPSAGPGESSGSTSPSASATPSHKPSNPPESPTATSSPTPSETSHAPKPTKTTKPSPTTSKPTTPPNSIALQKDIPVGGGKVFEKEKVVVTQPKKGQFKAFSAVCTHQGCLVASVQNNVIKCPCHGAQYSAADGSVTGGPAPKALTNRKIKAEGDGLLLG